MGIKYSKHDKAYFDSYCAQCGFSHRKPDRLRRLKRSLPNTFKSLCSIWPCIYGVGNKSNERMLFRDLHLVGAKSRYLGGEWYMPEDEP